MTARLNVSMSVTAGMHATDAGSVFYGFLFVGVDGANGEMWMNWVCGYGENFDPGATLCCQGFSVHRPGASALEFWWKLLQPRLRADL